MKLFSWLLFIVGLLLVLSVVLTTVIYWYWNWTTRPPLLFDPATTIIYPIPKVKTEDGRFRELTMNMPNAWFPSMQAASVSATNVSDFLISIPRVKVTNILVKVNGTNLKTGPVHYTGSALPGQIGNTVILGHSALPHLYLFKSPLAVFNPLLKVKIGDEIKVDFNQISYWYKVDKIVEVTPDKIEVLSQPSDKRQITLITCVPLGTYLRRLVIIGELI